MVLWYMAEISPFSSIIQFKNVQGFRGFPTFDSRRLQKPRKIHQIWDLIEESSHQSVYTSRDFTAYHGPSPRPPLSSDSLQGEARSPASCASHFGLPQM